MAGGTGDVDVGEEVHFYFVDAVALAGFATTAADVEGKTAGFITADFGLGLGSEEVADSGKDAGVSRGVTTRGTTDGGLVNDDDLVEIVDSLDFIMETGDGLGMVKAGEEFVREDGIDEGGFSGARDAGDDGHDAEGEVGGEVFQVVFASADDGEVFVAFRFPAFGRSRDFELSGEVFPG